MLFSSQARHYASSRRATVAAEERYELEKRLRREQLEALGAHYRNNRYSEARLLHARPSYQQMGVV